MPLDELHLDLDSAARQLSEVAEDMADLEGSARLDLTLQDADMERYQAAHVKLAKEVCRDEQAREL